MALPPVAAMVAHCTQLLQERLEKTGPSGLIVGCGSGDEVVYIRQMLESRSVLGVDIRAAFSSLVRAENCVLIADARQLPFPSGAFEFAASFHSLEHVGDPYAALDEIRRVLRPGGWFYVGVPNRTRILGYLGSHDATTWQKIAWNCVDWWARLRGRFRNESGAHAGFDKQELLDMLRQRFSEVSLLTEQFVRFKYGCLLPKMVVDVLLAPRLMNYSVTSHYALCQKGTSVTRLTEAG
jgi:SAM-dependent methyltransferase